MIYSAAVIGCGKSVEGKEGFGRGHAIGKATLEAYPGVKLYGVDIHPENLQAFGETFDLPPEQLFLSTEDMYAALVPDVVSIVTWPGLHCEQVIEAANAGVKGVMCEKPLAVDAGEIERMFKVTEKKGIPLTVAHQRRYQGKFQIMKTLIEQGRFGEKVVLQARIGDGWDMLSWATHWFDMANFLFGGPPRSVLAGMDIGDQRRYGHAIENESVVFAEYSDTRQAVFISGPNEIPAQGFTIDGDLASGRLVKGGFAVMSADGVEIVPLPKNDMGADTMLMHELGQAIEHGTPMVCGIDACAPATLMAYAAHESALKQKKILLKDVMKFAPLEMARLKPTPKDAPLRITLLADRHHTDPVSGKCTRDGLSGALEARGQTVHLVPLEEREVKEADVAECDLLMISHTQFESSDETRTLVGDWIQSGKPATIVHCGIGGWPDWQAFREWSGFYWVWKAEQVAADAGKPPSGHPHVPCTIEVVDPDVFPVGWKDAWLPKDEVYVDLYPGDEVRLLVTTDLSGVTQPIAWQNRERPNLTTWLPGHLPDIWELDAMRDGVMACCRLAVESACEPQCV